MPADSDAGPHNTLWESDFDTNMQKGTSSWWCAFFPKEGFKTALLLEFPLFLITELEAAVETYICIQLVLF